VRILYIIYMLKADSPRFLGDFLIRSGTSMVGEHGKPDYFLFSWDDLMHRTSLSY